MILPFSPHYLAILASGVLAILPSCQKAEIKPVGQNPEKAPSAASSVLRVSASIQYPDLLRPWLKKQPFIRAGLATVIEGGRLLVSADMVAHSTYIELEKPEDGPKSTAIIEELDEEANLAVIKPTDTNFLKGTIPLAFTDEVKVGSKLDILQLEENGSAALSPATITTVAIMPYPADDTAYLTYRAATVIPQREDSFVIPALFEGKLAGLVMRYDGKTQSADIIPSPLIQRFLKESTKPGYTGLARAGLTWEQVRGSTLREWMGAGNDREGVFVTWVEPEGPADKGGLRAGDLLLKADGNSIDGEGNYLDPVHGKIMFSNLASLHHSPGDVLEISYFRSTAEGKGMTNTTTLKLSGGQLASEISPSRLSGDSIPYIFVGSLLFQELSRPYLREWGRDWRREAPQNLLYLDTYQHELPRNQGHIVILSSLFPSAQTVGFQDLGKRPVVSFNDREIHRLTDITEAMKHPLNGFHKILLEGSGGPIYLDAATCAADEQAIRAQYGIPNTNPSPN